jgi:hypothetical protein
VTRVQDTRCVETRGVGQSRAKLRAEAPLVCFPRIPYVVLFKFDASVCALTDQPYEASRLLGMQHNVIYH